MKNCVSSIWRITAVHKRLYRLPNKISVKHCVKGVRIRSYSGPHFPVFGLNTDRYGVSLSIQSKCGKNADQNNSEQGHVLRSKAEDDLLHQINFFGGHKYSVID